MKPERRSQNRVTQGLEAMTVSIARSRDNYVSARLVDLSARGAAVSVAVPKSGAELIRSGDVVYLSFEIKGAEPIVDIVSHVRHAREGNNEQVLGLEIADWRELHERLPRRVLALFNRRRDFRVEVPRVPPTSVSVRVGEQVETLSAQLLDISANGCRIRVDPRQAPKVGDEVFLDFHLPDGDFEYHLGGKVRSLTWRDQFAECGIEFLGSHSP